MYSFLDLLKTDLTSTDNRFRQHCGSGSKKIRVRNISFHPLGSGSVIILYRSADPRIATITLLRLVGVFCTDGSGSDGILKDTDTPLAAKPLHPVFQ